MKQKEKIRNYGVQNSTMDDVFSRVTRDRNFASLEKPCQRVFGNAHFFTGYLFHLSQFTGLFVKRLRVHSRRWALTLVVLLLPILLSSSASRRRDENGIFSMDVNALNPQTILVHADPVMKKYLQAAVAGQVTLEERGESLGEINALVRERRIHRPSTYTEIFFSFRSSSTCGRFLSSSSLVFQSDLQLSSDRRGLEFRL